LPAGPSGPPAIYGDNNLFFIILYDLIKHHSDGAKIWYIA